MSSQTRPTKRTAVDPSLGSWILANYVGQFVAIGEVGVFMLSTSGPITAAIPGATAGLALGAAQWPGIRGIFGEIRVFEWLSASVLGGAVIGELVAAAARGPYDVSSLPLAALAVLAFGLVCGGIFGGVQGWALRRRRGLALRWAAANAIGYFLGLLFVLCCGLSTYLTPASPAPGSPEVVVAACIAAMALATAATTGIVLRSYGGRRSA